MTPAKSRALRLIVLVALTACVGDPMGPGELRVAVDGVEADSVLVGAPGEAVPSGVGLRVTDAAGAPVQGATVVWNVVGKDARLLTPWTATDRDGQARADWVLGTDAGELQQLNVAVRLPGKEAQVVIKARAVPHVVTQLRVALDTPAVLRLGDTLPIRVSAIDPYGNAFPAPDLAVTLGDSGIGTVVSAGVIGAGRGHSNVHVASNGFAAEFPLHVTQFVASIVPLSDTIAFSAIGAELPLKYAVRDDRGRIVADTAAAITIGDTTKVQVTGNQLRSVAPGATDVRLAIGPVAATVLAGVRQRVASLTLDTIRFDALLDTVTVRAIARDSLNVDVLQPSLSYQVSNGQVARFVSGPTLSAMAPGSAVVTVRDSTTGISASADVVVRQRVASITLPVTRVQLDAIADTISIGAATARDRLGSVINGAVLEYSVNDSSIAALLPEVLVRSVGPGQALLTARDPESGVTGQAVVVVDQVATALTVTVDSAKPIVTLPAGATLPLSCQAFDRNGFPIVQNATLVGSVRGTVTGGGCADARVARSGYDTLVFTLGAAHARVPVIVSTGDSVSLAGASHPLKVSLGFMAISQPLDPRITFTGEDLANPLILALRPLVNEIFAAYGNPTSSLDRARAIRDWLARTAVHPHPPLHPSGSTSNLGVLPPGKAWSDVNALIFAPSKDSMLSANVAYWSSVGYDGYAMLNRLLGTLDLATGLRAEDGMMVRVGAARYQIRDLRTYRYPICTYQSIMVNALWAAAGLHGMLIPTLWHDPAAVFIPELGRWVYEDPTFNEEYLLDGAGDPLSPADLLALSSAGQGNRLRSLKTQRPSFDPSIYIAGDTYVGEANLGGFVIMGSQLNSRVAGIGGWPTRLVQIDVPALALYTPFNDPLKYVPVTEAVAFPRLGVVVQPLQVEDSVYLAPLSSAFPNHQRFERRVSGGAWQTVADLDVLPVGQCRVEYRSVDAIGNVSATAVLDVWAPRAPGFVESGLAGSARARAGYCGS